MHAAWVVSQRWPPHIHPLSSRAHNWHPDSMMTDVQVT